MGRASRAKAVNRDRRRVSETARQELGNPVVLWGIPGAGKSTFARWLANEKGYEHVDNDAIALRGPRTSMERAWTRVGESPERFITAATDNQKPVVVEYGMYANEAGVGMVRRLWALGAEPWWFDGDHDSAREAWRDENRKSKRPFPDDKWDEVVGVVKHNWPLVEELLGERIVQAIRSGREHVPPESTYHHMVAVRRRAST